MLVKELLKNENCWTQGCYARDSENNRVPSYSLNACKFCLVGAINKCYLISNIEIMDKVAIKLNLPADLDSIIAWNDAKDRKFEDVKNLVEELNI